MIINDKTAKIELMLSETDVMMDELERDFKDKIDEETVAKVLTSIAKEGLTKARAEFEKIVAAQNQKVDPV
jgi:hypothetical protein